MSVEARLAALRADDERRRAWLDVAAREPEHDERAGGGMSLADEPQGLLGSVAGRFADADAQRMAELDRAIAEGRGNVAPKEPPVTGAAPARPARITTGALIEELTHRLDREVNGKMPDGLPGGRKGSTARLAVPRLTAAASGVMTDQACRCGCGRKLRKNNASGWSGYCNPARYAAGERPPRSEGATMPVRGRCKGCDSGGRCKSDCPEKAKRDGAAPAKAAPAAAPSPRVAGDAPFDARGRDPDELLAIVAACRAELQRLRDDAAAIVKKVDQALQDLAA